MCLRFNPNATGYSGSRRYFCCDVDTLYFHKPLCLYTRLFCTYENDRFQSDGEISTMERLALSRNFSLLYLPVQVHSSTGRVIRLLCITILWRHTPSSLNLAETEDVGSANCCSPQSWSAAVHDGNLLLRHLLTPQ